MRKHALITALSLVTVFSVLNSQPAHAQTQNQTTTAKPANIVVVQPGDSLTKIATASSTTYIRLYDANAHVADPDVIHPGGKFTCPGCR